jgi:SIR2-like domain
LIKNRTTLIVGAGASNDLGLPVGSQLQTIVHRLLTESNTADYQHIWQSIRIALGNDSNRYEDILRRAPEFLVRMLSAASIDNFLDQHKDEFDLVTSLKCAIVYAIAKHEMSSKIGLGRQNLDEIVRSNSHYFLFDLMNFVVRGHQVDNIVQSLQNLSVITFNYDRCIERYIEQWLVYRFGPNAAELARSVSVLHVYGSIDSYFESEFESPFLRKGEIPYANPIAVVPHLASRIKLFTEQEDTEIPTKIASTVRSSQVLCFLGFGFEEQNMRFFTEGFRHHDVFATAFGFGKANTDFLTKRLMRFSSTKKSVHVINGKCKEVFSEFYMPLAHAIGTV